MNPLFSLFILALFIEDYIFREGKYWKMYLYAIGLYTLFYTFQHRSTFHSPNKKYNMAGYNQSFEHRYVDGVLCAKMVREARRLFDNPEAFKVV